MYIEWLFLFIPIWVVSAIYVMVYHGRRWRLGLDIIIGAIILGPILALLIGDDEEKIIKEKRKKERESTTALEFIKYNNKSKYLYSNIFSR